MKTEYTSIALPVDFVKEKIDPLVNQKKFGFASRATVVIEAVKALADKLAKESQDTSNSSSTKTSEAIV